MQEGDTGRLAFKVNIFHPGMKTSLNLTFVIFIGAI